MLTRLSAWGGVRESVRAHARLDAASRPAHAYLLVERLLLLLLHEEQRIDLPPRQTFSAPPLPHVVFIRLMAPPSLTHPPLTLYHGGRCAHQAHGAPLTHTTPHSRCLMVDVVLIRLMAPPSLTPPLTHVVSWWRFSTPASLQAAREKSPLGHPTLDRYLRRPSDRCGAWTRHKSG